MPRLRGRVRRRERALELVRRAAKLAYDNGALPSDLAAAALSPTIPSTVYAKDPRA